MSTAGNGTGTGRLTDYFTTAPRPSIPRLAVSAAGLTKHGTSHWSILTTPTPVAVVHADTGTPAILNKARNLGRKIIDMQVQYEIPDPAIIAAKDVDKAEHDAWKKEWARVKAALKAVIADKTIRTLVWDKASQIWDLAQLSHFGKLRGNARMDVRTELNADFSRVFWSLYNERPDLNLVMIHSLSKEYKKGARPDAPGEWTGEYEQKGFNQFPGMVDMTVLFQWDRYRKDFYTELDPNQATRYGAELLGNKWYAGDGKSSFTELAFSVFPETELEPEYWGV